MIVLLRQAASHGCDLVAFPELALTTFFPRWFMADQAEVDSFLRKGNALVLRRRPCSMRPERLKLAFTLGFAELVVEEGVTRHFNTQVMVDKAGNIIGRYRKIHLPGHQASMSRGVPSSIWKSAILKPATCHGRSGGRMRRSKAWPVSA